MSVPNRNRSLSTDPKGKSPSNNSIYFAHNENFDVKNKKSLAQIKSTSLLILQSSSKSAERNVPLGNLTFGIKAPLNLKCNVEASISQISSQSSLSIDSVDYDFQIQKDNLLIDKMNDASPFQLFGETYSNYIPYENQSKFNANDLASEQEKLSASSSDSMIFPLNHTNENTQSGSSSQKSKHYENYFSEAYFLKLGNSNDNLSASTKFKYPSITLAKNSQFNSSLLEICNRDLSLDSLELEQPPESLEIEGQLAKNTLFKENLVVDLFPKELANEFVSKIPEQVPIELDNEQQIIQGSIPENGLVIEQAFKLTETQNLSIKETELMPIEVDGEKKHMLQQPVDNEGEIVEAPLIPIENNMSLLRHQDYITKIDSFPEISEIKNKLEVRFENDIEYHSLDLNLKNKQWIYLGSTQESTNIGKEQNNRIYSCKQVKNSKYHKSFRKKTISKKGLANNFKLDPSTLFQYLEENLKSQKYGTSKKSLHENSKSECNNLDETLQSEKEFDSKFHQFINRISQDYGLDTKKFTNQFNHDFQPFLKNHIMQMKNSIDKLAEKTISLDLAIKKSNSNSARLEEEDAMNRRKIRFLEKELFFEKSHYRFEKKLFSKQISNLEKHTINRDNLSSEVNHGKTEIHAGNSLEQKKYYLDRILELKKNCVDLALDKTDLLAQIELYVAKNQSLQFSLNEKSQIIVENASAISDFKKKLSDVELQNSNLLDSLKKVQIREALKENEMEQLNDALFEKELKFKHFITEKCLVDELNSKKEFELNTEIDKLKIEACDLKMKPRLLQSDNEKKILSIEHENEELRNLKSNLVQDAGAKDQIIQRLDRDLFQVNVLLENSKKLFSERESQLQNELKTKSKKYATELAQLAFKYDSDLAIHKENQAELNNEISKLEFILAEKDEIIKKRKDDCLKLEEELQMNFNFKEENSQLAEICKKLENEKTCFKLQLSEAKEMKSKKLKITSELEKQLAQHQQKNENLVKKLTDSTNLLNETKRKLDSEKESSFSTISKNNILFSDKIKNLQDIIATKDLLNIKLNQDKEIQMQKTKGLEEDLKKLKMDINLNTSCTDINLLQSENWDLAAKLDYLHIIMTRDFKEKVQAMQSINTIRLR